jgi:hypothetical protein
VQFLRFLGERNIDGEVIAYERRKQGIKLESCPKKILLTLGRTNLTAQKAIAMKKLPLPDMNINWNWTCPLTGKKLEHWGKMYETIVFIGQHTAQDCDPQKKRNK